MNTVNCFQIIKDLFYTNRSLTGKGNLKTLKYIKKIIPKLKIKHFNSGEKYYDWTIPKEWNVKDAYIKDLNGKKIIVKSKVTIYDLLKKFKLNNKKIAIEHNGIIISKTNYRKKYLKSNDKLEVVHFIGGGQIEKRYF